MFVGRTADLARLAGHLERVRTTGEGVLLSIRGRRQVGKSRLVDEFLRRAEVPSAYWTATSWAAPAEERASLLRTVAASSLTTADDARDTAATSWEAVLRRVGAVEQPSVLVLDELPYLLAADPGVEGVLQTVWDTALARRPLLLVVIGSSISTMSLLDAYDRPLHGRLREQVVEPLPPAEAAGVVGLAAADALDAHLVHGGFPRLLAEWRPGELPLDHVRRQLEDSTAPLVVVGERVLAAEFPPHLRTGDVLRAIGSGATTFDRIGRAAHIDSGQLSRALRTLGDQTRVVRVRRPLAARPSRLTRYEVADAYLRFWLRFVGPDVNLLLRGRGGLVSDRIAERWATYRGLAIEPLVRAGLERLLPHPALPGALHVGSWWSRDGSVEVDLVGADRPAAPADVAFVGEVKWRETAPFDQRDLRRLAAAAAAVPGADDVPLVAVSRAGVRAPVDLALGAEDLLTGS